MLVPVIALLLEDGILRKGSSRVDSMPIFFPIGSLAEIRETSEEYDDGVVDAFDEVELEEVKRI